MTHIKVTPIRSLIQNLNHFQTEVP